VRYELTHTLQLNNTDRIQYNTIQYKTYNAPYVTKTLFVGTGIRDTSYVAANVLNRITLGFLHQMV